MLNDNGNRYRYDGAVTNSVEAAAHLVSADGTGWPELVSYADLKNLGVSRYALEQAVQTRSYERVSPGVFRRTGAADDTTAAWTAVAAKRPQATLCLLTAASLHDLTDEIPRRSHIAIPRGTHPITVKLAPIRWHSFGVATFDIGRQDHDLPGGGRIGLYSPERTVIDFFRMRHDWGTDMATGVLKRWLAVRGHTPSTLLAMAKSFPDAYPPLRSTLEVLL